jgi:3-oxoacyl-[acyl-carrier-protein] synthase-3
MPATITAISHYFPPDIYTNAYFENYLDTSDEWITTRTGIKERHILKEGATSDLIVPAAIKMFEKFNINPQEIDVVVVATVTPDFMFPNTASVIIDKLGIKNAWGYDVSAACSGFIFALRTAASLVESGVAKKVLLCGGDKMSSITDYQDRANAILFGDGGTTCLLEMSNDPNYGILDQILSIDGSGGKYLKLIAGGSFKPASIETVKNGEHYLYQDGQPVFKAAVKGMADVTLKLMEKNNLSGEDISYFVPHQANMRIITATAERMELPKDKVMINIDKYGNTTAATIPSCISEWYEAGKIHKGDNLILSSFGAGYTYGSVLLRWNMND